MAALQYEARTGPFDGQNQLGLLTDLTSARLALNKPVGLAELGLVVGALWDMQGRFGTVELGARVGLHLPFADLKVFAEGVVRGLPAVLRTEEPLPGALDLKVPIRPAGVLALGLVSRTFRAVDFALVSTVGFGSAPPFMFNIRLVGVDIGYGYPRPRSLLLEMAGELASWIKGRIQNIDPYFDKHCVLFDDNHKPIAPISHFGELSHDGKKCLWRGRELPVGTRLWRDKGKTRICRDARLRDCLLIRPNDKAPWELAPAPRVGSDC